jgi:hypothetical protein
MRLRRRDLIRIAGVNLFLPQFSPLAPWLLEKAYALTTRTNFVGMFFPNGAYMPTGSNGSAANGDWTWTGALAGFEAANLKNNVMIIRNLRNGFSSRDPHWQNVAGLLSGRKIVLDANDPKAGESIDQMIARTRNTYLKSIQVGPSYYYVHPQSNHADYSSLYTNRISYNLQGRPLNAISNPQALFDSLFTTGTHGAGMMAKYREKKKSILDITLAESKALKSRLPAEQRPKLEIFEDSVRSVEAQLARTPPACDANGIDASLNVTDINATFVQRNQLINNIVCLALQCGLTQVATVMYGPSVSASLDFRSSLGLGYAHHTCAHHGNDANKIARLKSITRLYIGLYVHLLSQMRTMGILNNSLVFIGSDMSDGNIHNTRNLPVLLAGAGSDLKFGQEIVPTTALPLTSLHLAVLKTLGVPGVVSLGEEEMLSTQSLSSIFSG